MKKSIEIPQPAPWGVLAALLLSAAAVSSPADPVRINSDQAAFQIEAVINGLDHPWGMAFLGEGDLLITERTGQLRRVRGWRLLDEPVSGLPPIREVGQGGLLDVALHPEYEDNQLVYLSYTGREGGRYGTEVLRGRLDGMRLTDTEVIFRALPKETGGQHFGSRLLFGPGGYLYITLGDRGASPSLGKAQPSQQPGNHLGSLIRLNPDGSVPANNPYADRRGAKPEIYTYGNRNMQGIAVHPGTGAVWTHEHGPQGGDEINIMRRGVNYGWPVITYGANYGTGTQIGEGTHHPGMAQPLYKWIPSIAPSGMAFYTGDKFPAWRGDLFVGSLKLGLLVRLELSGSEVVDEERLLNNRYGRIRDVVQGPDGYLYLLTDESDGKLLKISPVQE